MKINFVKDRVERIRSTPEKLYPVLLTLLLLGYGVTLGLGILGYQYFKASQSVARKTLQNVKPQARASKKHATNFTEKDRQLAKHARRLRKIMDSTANAYGIMHAVAGSLPDQAALESFQMRAGDKIQITGVVAARSNARGMVWDFVRKLREDQRFSEQVTEINLQKATAIDSPRGMRFVILAPLSGNSLRSFVRSAH